MKLLAIGNSFAVNSLTYLRQIFENAGMELTLGYVSIGGCPLSLHWYNAENDVARYGLEYEGSFTMREMLTSENWDVVTLQQVSHESWKIGTYHPYIENLVDYVKQYAPQAKILLQQTWAYRSDNERLVKEYQISQSQMFSLIRENYNSVSASLGLPIMPVGEAFVIHQELTADTVGSLTRHSDAPSHANRLGQYIGGLVWYGVLTGKDPTSITFLPERVSEEQAITAKKAVIEAIARYR